MLKNLLISKWFTSGFILLGCLLQLLVFDEEKWLSLISGLCGVICVVLVSRRKMSQFLFGFIQLGTYLIISFKERLWGETGMTLLFIFLMILAVKNWSKNCDGFYVNPRNFGKVDNIFIAILTIIGTLGLWRVLMEIKDSQPFMDALTTVPAITAQILMTYRYREQWIYWFIIDLGAIVMWSIAGDFNMVAQYGFWALNCIYGWILWKKN